MTSFWDHVTRVFARTFVVQTHNAKRPAAASLATGFQLRGRDEGRFGVFTGTVFWFPPRTLSSCSLTDGGQTAFCCLFDRPIFRRETQLQSLPPLCDAEASAEQVYRHSHIMVQSPFSVARFIRRFSHMENWILRLYPQQ